MAAALRRVFAPLTLAVFLCSLMLPLVPGAHVVWDDDEDGAPGIAAVHHPITGFTPVSAPEPVQHCALCHWQHALAGAAVVEIVSAIPGFVAGEICTVSCVVAPGESAPVDQPSRAPPASTL